MSIKLIGNYYTDEHNNRWTTDRYTQEEAKNASENLVNCHHCIDCFYCIDCDNCTNCTFSTSCQACTNCDKCVKCVYCNDCIGCTELTNYSNYLHINNDIQYKKLKKYMTIIKPTNYCYVNFHCNCCGCEILVNDYKHMDSICKYYIKYNIYIRYKIKCPNCDTSLTKINKV